MSFSDTWLCDCVLIPVSGFYVMMGDGAFKDQNVLPAGQNFYTTVLVRL